jgi:hypothetical protein
MSLAEIRAIASEVGIDPELVSRAAALVAGSAGTGFGTGRLLWHRARAKAVERSKRIMAAAMSALPGAPSER